MASDALNDQQKPLGADEELYSQIRFGLVNDVFSGFIQMTRQDNPTPSSVISPIGVTVNCSCGRPRGPIVNPPITRKTHST